jgi:hypothetical protein
MKTKIRVLWIEDAARFDLAALSAPVHMDDRFFLSVAEDASAGMLKLQEGEFDVVIVDIRIPCGEDPTWIQLHERLCLDHVQTRLGLHLLSTILKDPKAQIKAPPGAFGTLRASQIGVLTVEGESELDESLKGLGVNVYQQKQAGLDEESLLTLILRVVAEDSQRRGE